MKVFVLGGTSEARACARAVAAAGHEVVLSVLTEHGAELARDEAMPAAFASAAGSGGSGTDLDAGGFACFGSRDVGADDARASGAGCVVVRQGALEEDGFRRELAECSALVDAAHPFACRAREEVWAAANALGLPALRLTRNALEEMLGAWMARDHHEAAIRSARDCPEGRGILLTTGTRVLAPYIESARAMRRRLVVRCLPVAESLEACRSAGIPSRDIVALQGPFSVAFEQALFAECQAGALVTKESGLAGGLDRKLEACRLSGIPAIVVRRPEEAHPATGQVEGVVRWLAG